MRTCMKGGIWRCVEWFLCGGAWVNLVRGDGGACLWKESLPLMVCARAKALPHACPLDKLTLTRTVRACMLACACQPPTPHMLPPPLPLPHPPCPLCGPHPIASLRPLSPYVLRLFSSLISSSRSYFAPPSSPSCRPDVLLVERSVARAAQEELLARGISLVHHTKPELLERLARCMGVKVWPRAPRKGMGQE